MATTDDAKRATAFGKSCIRTAHDRELRMSVFITGLAWALFRVAGDKTMDYLGRFNAAFLSMRKTEHGEEAN